MTVHDRAAEATIRDVILAAVPDSRIVGVEVAAIGDNPNDIPMFAVAGLSAAVGDGHPDARKAARITVGPCADGAVADLVAHVTA